MPVDWTMKKPVAGEGAQMVGVKDVNMTGLPDDPPLALTPKKPNGVYVIGPGFAPKVMVCVISGACAPTRVDPSAASIIAITIKLRQAARHSEVALEKFPTNSERGKNVLVVVMIFPAP